MNAKAEKLIHSRYVCGTEGIKRHNTGVRRGFGGGGNFREHQSMSLRHIKHLPSDERGVSFVELAIFLPVLLLIIAGVVDYGFALREVQVIASAAREGARIAASHSRVNKVPCSDKKSPVTGVACDGTLKIANTDPVDVTAKKSACSFIRTSGLTSTDWLVTAAVPAPVIEDATAFDVVTVSIERNPKSNACILCWESILEAFRARTESTFTLESACVR